MSKRRVTVGARGSLLSVCQTESVIRLLRRKAPGVQFVFKKITTLGDRVKQWKRSDTGIFVKELEDALTRREIDLAVHSVKDLPSQLPGHLELAAILKREDPRDLLITRGDRRASLDGIAGHALVGTTSLRRKAMLRSLRPDLRVEDLRGNLDTRLRKLDAGLYDAIIVAAAGIKRLRIQGLNAAPLPLEIMLPACGQGALGIEIRQDDAATAALVRKIDDPATRLGIISERAFLHHTQAGCRMPVAAYARVSEEAIVLEGMIISLDGTQAVRMRACADHTEAEELGKRLARAVLREGGKEILQEIRRGQE